MFEPDICIYHGNCDDGFGAAWAIWKRWPNCEFVAGVYGDDPPFNRCNDKRVLMVDFSYKKPVLEKLMSHARDITILDHHKTAQADLETYAILNPVSADNIDEVLAATQPGLGPIRAEFDMTRSGAMMAWQFVFPDSLIPDFLKLVQDRDLWLFKYGDRTKQFSAALRTYPMDFKTWDGLMVKVPELVTAGEVVLRAHTANIEKFVRDAYMDEYDTFPGHVVPVVNVPYHYASDTAHALLQKYPDAPFAACWFKRGDGMIQWSLRSEDSRTDVSEVAKSYGGGGHRNAAGFQIAGLPNYHSGQLRSRSHWPLGAGIALAVSRTPNEISNLLQRHTGGLSRKLSLPTNASSKDQDGKRASRTPRRREMIVLIGVNCDNGKVVEVGLYDDVEAARPYVAKNGGRRILYSVWTPEQNETMSTPAITGLSLPPVA